MNENQINVEDNIAHSTAVHETMMQNIDVSQEPELDLFDCELCALSGQHKCRRCDIPVCNLYCSIQDPSSDLEMHRVHRNGDPRCKSSHQKLKCPKCDDSFGAIENLDKQLN